MFDTKTMYCDECGGKAGAEGHVDRQTGEVWCRDCQFDSN